MLGVGTGSAGRGASYLRGRTNGTNITFQSTPRDPPNNLRKGLWRFGSTNIHIKRKKKEKKNKNKPPKLLN